MRFDGNTLTMDPGERLERRTLYIHLTRGQRAIRQFALSQFGPFERIALVVDGEEHVYDADAVIAALEAYEEEL